MRQSRFLSPSRIHSNRALSTPSVTNPDTERSEPQPAAYFSGASAEVLRLQRQIGNRAVLGLIGRSAPDGFGAERSQPPSREVIPINRHAGDIVQTKLQGASSVFADLPTDNAEFRHFLAKLTKYEAKERKEVARRLRIKRLSGKQSAQVEGAAAEQTAISSSTPGRVRANAIASWQLGLEHAAAAQAAISSKLSKLRTKSAAAQQRMIRRLVHLTKQVNNLIGLSLDIVPQNVKYLLLQLKTRLALEKTDLEGKRFDDTTGYSDTALDAGASTDNRYGGALNKLDELHYNRAGGPQETALYKPETAVDPAYGLHSGTQVGIPEKNPNFGGRSVAMYRLDQLLDVQLIGRTEFATHRRQNLDADNSPVGQPMPSFGIIMERAKGQEARSDILKRGNVAFSSNQAHTMREQGAKEPLDLHDPVLQRGLNKLQILDALCGQVDRHMANIMVEQNAQGGVTKVTGIDNDLAFGKKQTDPTKYTKVPGYSRGHFKGLPPLADLDLAEKIMQIEPTLISDAVKGLLEEAEITALMARFDALKEHLKILKAENKLKAPNEWDEMTARGQEQMKSYLGEMTNEARGHTRISISMKIADILNGADWTMGENVVRSLLVKRCAEAGIAEDATVDAGVTAWRDAQTDLITNARDHFSNQLSWDVATGLLTARDALDHATRISYRLKDVVENRPGELIRINDNLTVEINESVFYRHGEAQPATARIGSQFVLPSVP